MSDDHFTHRCELFDAADMRLAEFGREDMEEWGLELPHTEYADLAAGYDGLRYAAAWLAMSALPMPEFEGEDQP